MTDPRILDQWFIPGDLGTTVGAQYQLRPRDTDGLGGSVDVEILAAVEPERLVMQWTGEKLHTEMTWVLRDTPTGSRLSIVQTGFIGTPQSVRRQQLRGAYTALFTQALPAALDRLANGEIDLGAAQPLMLNTALPRPPRPSKPARSRPGLFARLAAWSRIPWRTTGTAIAVAGLLALAVTVIVVGLGGNNGPRQAQPLPQPIDGGLSNAPAGASAGGANGRSTDPGAPGGTPVAVGVPGGSPRAGGAGNTPAPGAQTATGSPLAPVQGGGGGVGSLSASYQTININGNGGYRGQVTISASGGSATGWTVVITLAGAAKVTTATGALFSQNGEVVTFTPDGNDTVADGGSTSFQFHVSKKNSGVTQPVSCAINGRDCAM